MKKDRVVYFDYLRVFAIFAVIVLHVVALNFYSYTGLNWHIFNFYDSIFRWGVPVFIMISGALFLDREINTKKLYKKYILRLVVSYFVWSALYAVGYSIIKGFGLSINKSLILESLVGEYHMWFIPMIIGLYISIPIIKQIIKSQEVTKYFLLVSLILTFIIPEFINIVNDFIGRPISTVINQGNSFISQISTLTKGFVSYFIFGYLLNNVELTQKQRKIIYILGAIGFLSTILLNSIVALKTKEPCQTYYENCSVNVALEAIAVHTWFKYRKYDQPKLNAIVSKLSKYSFGAYLVHVLIIKIFAKAGLNLLAFNPIISVPVISIIVAIISFAISYVINKIPFLNKWIV